MPVHDNKKIGKDALLLEELSDQLKHLRRLVREVGESFILRREGEIETLLAYFEALPKAKLKSQGPAWLRQISHLKLKPKKGRLKDLKEIDKSIDELLDGVIAAQEPSKKKGKIKPGASAAKPGAMHEGREE